MEDDKLLQDYGLTSHTAKVQNPATVGLTLWWVLFCKMKLIVFLCHIPSDNIKLLNDFSGMRTMSLNRWNSRHIQHLQIFQML